MTYYNTFLDSDNTELHLDIEKEKVTLICSRYDEATNILRRLAGLDELRAGESLDSALVTDENEMPEVGFLFKTGALISNLSLYENMMLPYKYYYPSEKWQYFDEQIKFWLDFFHIDLDINIRPAMVNASIQKVISYIRTILLDVEVFCFDDPFYQLAHRYRKKMIDCLLRLKENNNTMIISSNDLIIVKELADIVILMDNCKIIDTIVLYQDDKSTKLQTIKDTMSQWWL